MPRNLLLATCIAWAGLGWHVSTAQSQENIKTAPPQNKPAPAVPLLAETAPPPAVDVSGLGEFCHGGDCGSHHGHHWEAGVGLYYLQPRWETNPAFATSRIDALGNVATTQTDFNWNAQAAPLVWLGVDFGNGLSARLRYWQLDSDVSQSVVNDATATTAVSIITARPLGLGFFSTTAADQLTVSSTLRMQVLDAELGHGMPMGSWGVRLTGGLRFARLEQGYDASFLAAGGTFASTLSSNHTFNGLGLTAGLECRRPLCGSWSLYGGARGSILFGQGEQNATLTNVDAATGAVINTSTASTSQDDVLPTIELEAGVEWACDLGHTRIVFQTGFVSQTWFGAGNAANNETLDPGIVGFAATDNSSNLGLLGLRFSLGFQF